MFLEYFFNSLKIDTKNVLIFDMKNIPVFENWWFSVKKWPFSAWLKEVGNWMTLEESDFQCTFLDLIPDITDAWETDYGENMYFDSASEAQFIAALLSGDRTLRWKSVGS